MTDYFIKYRSSSVRCKLVLINQSLGQRIIIRKEDQLKITSEGDISLKEQLQWVNLLNYSCTPTLEPTVMWEFIPCGRIKAYLYPRQCEIYLSARLLIVFLKFIKVCSKQLTNNEKMFLQNFARQDQKSENEV